jgi:hypothetical protein
MRAVGSRAASLFFPAIAVVLVACDRSDPQIKVYRVSKAPLEAATSSTEATMPAANPSSSPSSLPSAAPLPVVTSSIPPNWEPQPLSQMRQASFLIHGENGAVADVSLVTLGPSAGSVLDNVNRWLAQLAQPPTTEENLPEVVRQMPTSRGDIAIVDISGKPENGDSSKDGRILGAIVSDQGRTAFYKMRGNAALVGVQKDSFLKWMSSSRVTLAAAPAAEASAPPTDADKPQIKWEVPPGWSPAAPAPMRYASFTAETNGEKVDISVVTFAGEGGSDADNINRWRQQIGLPPAEAGAFGSMIVPVRVGGISFSTVDMAGASARVVAGWTRHDGRAWFFKLTGPGNAVEKEKAKFLTFLKSVRF